jgi:hypothetical protein
MYDSKVQLLSTSSGLYRVAFYFCFYWQEPRLKTRVTQGLLFSGKEYKALTAEEARDRIEQGKRMLRLKLELYKEFEDKLCNISS